MTRSLSIVMIEKDGPSASHPQLSNPTSGSVVPTLSISVGVNGSFFISYVGGRVWAQLLGVGMILG